jgi:hypothetical protein
MDNEQQPPQTIRIVLDESVAQGEYVNFANIIHSQSEFIIAKQFFEALGQNIALFEQKYGEVRGDAAAPYSQNEPSN